MTWSVVNAMSWGRRGPGSGTGRVVDEAVVGVDHPVVEVGRLQPVAEEEHLAGGRVDLGVGRHAGGREPAVPRGGAEGLEGERVEAVEVAALPERGDGLAGVDDHVGAGRVLHPAPGAPAAGGLGRLGALGDPGPQGAAGLLLGLEALGADEAVAVRRPPVPEGHGVDHAVAVEGVVALDREVDGVLGVAEVDALEVVGQGALDHVHDVDGPLLVLRAPGPAAVGVVVVVGQRAQRPSDQLDVHRSSSVVGRSDPF